ncbi:MAG: sigma-70 family RNA polymerase sigma factor [Sedimentisphaerales bacterium]|nr:sigma-70 family RNA polymerase sigma factor [Sedimentisphaerales bacterium]
MFRDDTELPLNRETGEVNEQDDEKLLDAIRRKKGNAWSMLIERYQGRLTNFAISKLRKREDAEDITQDTFISFIKGLENYRGEVNLETYLFTIMRNKIIDKYRSNSVKSVSLIQDVFNSTQIDNRQNDATQITVASPSESWVVSQNEQYEIHQNILAEALLKLCQGFKSQYKFRNLKILEMLLYCGTSISTTAELIKVEESTIRAFKHRCLKYLQNYVESSNTSKEFPFSNFENLLTSTWESQRLTCPKRSTIGAFLLEQIDPEWFDYIDFHITTLGCHFCRANLKDLKQLKTSEENVFRERIMASTVGFFKKR